MIGTSKTQIVKEYIIDQMNAGNIRRGQRLPSCRALAVQLCVNKITVNKAYTDLEREHKLFSIPRGGFYLVDCKDGEASQTSECSADMLHNKVDFSAVKPDDKLIPYREFTHVINKAVDIYKNSLFDYESTVGLLSLRETLKIAFEKDGVYTNADRIIVTNGAQQAISLVLQYVFQNNKGKLLVEVPTYSLALKCAKQLGINIIGIELKMNGFGNNLGASSRNSNDNDSIYCHENSDSHNDGISESNSSYSSNSESDNNTYGNRDRDKNSDSSDSNNSINSNNSSNGNSDSDSNSSSNNNNNYYNHGLSYDYHKMEELLKKGDITAFYVIPRHQNPTANTLAEKDKKKIAELCNKYNVLIIEDDYLADLGSKKGAMPIHYYETNKNTVYIRSFSKTFMPGIRMGAVILPEAMVEEVTKLKHLSDLNTSKLPQAALELFIKSGMYEKHIKKVRKSYEAKLRKAREIFTALSPENLKWHIPEHGIFIWIQLPETIDAYVLEKNLSMQGILIKPAEEFFLEGAFSQMGTNCVRLCIAGVSEENIVKLATIILMIRKFDDPLGKDKITDATIS